MTSQWGNPGEGGQATGLEAGEGGGANGNRNGRGSECKEKMQWTGDGEGQCFIVPGIPYQGGKDLRFSLVTKAIASSSSKCFLDEHQEPMIQVAPAITT